MSRKFDSTIAVIGIDIGKHSFHVVGHDERGAIVLRWPGRRALCQHAAVPGRHGSLRRRPAVGKTRTRHDSIHAPIKLHAR